MSTSLKLEPVNGSGPAGVSPVSAQDCGSLFDETQVLDLYVPRGPLGVQMRGASEKPDG